jgi:hypothetical protein
LKAILISLSALILASPVYSQTEDIVKKMKANNSFMGSKVGYAGQKPEQYMLYEKLRDTSSKSDLIKLLSDDNGVIRAYACQALIEKGHDFEWFAFAKQSLTDYASISTMFGCIMSEEYTGDIIIEMLLSKLSAEEQKELSLSAIKNRSKLYFAVSILMSNEMSNELYLYTRDWALSGHSYSMLALAKYKKAEDRSLIMKLKETDESLFLRTIPLIRDDSLKPYMRKYLTSILPDDHYANEWKYFYIGLASFHDDFSRELLQEPFSKKVNPTIKKYHLEFIFNALAEYNDGFYDDFLLNLWNNYNLINTDVIKYFYSKNKSQTIESIRNSLNHSNEFFSNTESLDLMLSILIKEKIDISSIITKILPQASVQIFEIYFKYIDIVPESEMIKLLTGILNKETNGYIIIPIYKKLLGLHNTGIDAKLKNIYKNKRSKYMDWTDEQIKDLLSSKQ